MESRLAAEFAEQLKRRDARHAQHACAKCATTGYVLVPHPRFVDLKNALWLREPQFHYRPSISVICDCPTAVQKYPSAKLEGWHHPTFLTLRQYEHTICGYWSELVELDRAERESAALTHGETVDLDQDDAKVQLLVRYFTPRVKDHS